MTGSFEPATGRLASLLRDLDARHAEAEDFGQDELPHDPTNPEDLAEDGNIRLETSMGRLDIMQWIPGIPGELAYPALARDAITADVHGPVTVCSREHLLLMKRAANRPIDRADLDQLGELVDE